MALERILAYAQEEIDFAKDNLRLAEDGLKESWDEYKHLLLLLCKGKDVAEETRQQGQIVECELMAIKYRKVLLERWQFFVLCVTGPVTKLNRRQRRLTRRLSHLTFVGRFNYIN